MKWFPYILQFSGELTYLLIVVHISHVSLVPFFGGLTASLLSLTRITINRRCPIGWPITPLAGLSTGFEAICHFPTALEEIYLTDRLFFDDLCQPGRELRKLDTVLGSSAWSRLTKVCIRFDTNVKSNRRDYWRREPDVRDVETTLRQDHFSNLSSRETVSFSITISRHLESMDL